MADLGSLVARKTCRGHSEVLGLGDMDTIIPVGCMGTAFHHPWVNRAVKSS